VALEALMSWCWWDEWLHRPQLKSAKPKAMARPKDSSANPPRDHAVIDLRAHSPPDGKTFFPPKKYLFDLHFRR
jgi:hypothetical protein